MIYDKAVLQCNKISSERDLCLQ